MRTHKNCAKVSLTIDKTIVQKAHHLGLNISRTCELALQKKIQLLEQGETPKEPFLSTGSSAEESVLVRSPRFEPGSSAWQGTDFDWSSFRDSLKAKNYQGSYESTVFNYALQYGKCLFDRDLSKVRELPASKCSQVLKALSALAKYTGRYEEYMAMLKNYGLNWVGRSSDDLIIDRLNKASDPERIWTWIKLVKEARPELNEFMDLISVTGLRFVETFDCYNLITELSKKKELVGKYYNPENGFLEHFRFKQTFIRKTKKAFVSYVPLDLLERIGKKDPFIHKYNIEKRLTTRGLPVRFSDVRENHATFCTKWLRPEEVDFFHGRVSASVFMKHYYTPWLVTDLRQRAAQAAKEIMAKIGAGQLKVGIETT